MSPLLAFTLACAPPASPPPVAAPEADPARPQPTAATRAVIAAPPQGPPAVSTEELDAAPSASELLFDPSLVRPIQIALSESAIASLRKSPTTWVEGALTWQDQVWSPVGVRLKGSASWQGVDQKPAWKISIDHYVEGQRFFGLETLTLNNEVWDATMLAETYAYKAFRANGSPAPRTGYASVTLNERYLGVYAILESMDDDFMDDNWPGSNGGIWEMTRSCDFNSDCSCFDLQETGPSYDPDGLVRGCEAVSVGTLEALQGAFEWDALIAFLAVERAVNHPDSYSFNLNNFFVIHDPLKDRLSLSPWGSDSTFTYLYPPSAANPDCQPLYLDVRDAHPVGWLAGFCERDDDCRAQLDARMLEVADWMEAEDLPRQMQQTADLLLPYVSLETWTNWDEADHLKNVDCFVRWTTRRPEELRDWVAARER